MTVTKAVKGMAPGIAGIVRLCASSIERLRDFLRVLGDGPQSFRAVKMLAAGDEPDFKRFGIFHEGMEKSAVTIA